MHGMPCSRRPPYSETSSLQALATARDRPARAPTAISVVGTPAPAGSYGHSTPFHNQGKRAPRHGLPKPGEIAQAQTHGVSSLWMSSVESCMHPLVLPPLISTARIVWATVSMGTLW